MDSYWAHNSKHGYTCRERSNEKKQSKLAIIASTGLYTKYKKTVGAKVSLFYTTLLTFNESKVFFPSIFFECVSFARQNAFY